MEVRLSVLLRHVATALEIPVWLGMRDPISAEEVAIAILDGDLLDPDVHGSCDQHAMPRAWHVGRIAWFVVNGWRDPIQVDLNARWPVIDGNHRLVAAVLREDTFVEIVPHVSLEAVLHPLPDLD